ncbi:four helix bundle protein [Candidatus Dojkabacteria bacterium]|nr:four helix bundle protein [Candidatus Dojkabacteria bacterium]
MRKSQTLREIYTLADKFAHKSFKVARGLKEEKLFGTGIALRRISISIVFNIIQGLSRDGIRRTKSRPLLSLDRAYRNLEESKYLISFLYQEYKLEREKVYTALSSAQDLERLLFSLINDRNKSG